MNFFQGLPYKGPVFTKTVITLSFGAHFGPTNTQNARDERGNLENTSILGWRAEETSNSAPKQDFFPMGGKKDGWNRLAKTLKAEIDPDLIEKYAGNESLWFTVQPNSQIAVKIIDDRGIESLKVIKVGDE